MKSTIKKIEERFILYGFLVVGIMVLISLIIGIFREPSSQTINFNVTGVINSSNSSLVSLHLDCIKYCQENENSGYSELKMCYEQCSSLGRERCLDK